MSEYKYLMPKRRSKLRTSIGKLYFRQKRKLQWLKESSRFSKHRTNELLPYITFTHRTPILRRLKDVDMWMQHNKAENLKIAIRSIDGLVIEPREVFSYWYSLGKPTKRKGYKEGMILHYGKFRAGTGGGLCQLSNLLFWMTLHTPLNVIERHRHGFDVFPDSNRTQPFGSGASCVYNYRDLQIENTTEERYQFHIRIEEDYLIGEIRSELPKYFDYSVYEKDHHLSHEYWGAYVRHNSIWRKTLDLQGKVINDARLYENHALMMYEPLLSSNETAL
ncbi:MULTISPECIES: VanW family protein [unclassified Fusibacter]|uniref:VanW family protein n=1 Tax=unclassified Fusibacter TaxID=2624464 RepID=UPI001012A338|nr:MULTISPECIES: VanW family protein [unclassified Fusibacter]MCK8059004.1 VanW family protein [Fusibacter sp. A2]NPE22415.1 VanW family protein [Fusibacter sp. A1]RXV60521.1 vancomycin resistance protein [Fusibacter sp. A1]